MTQESMECSGKPNDRDVLKECEVIRMFGMGSLAPHFLYFLAVLYW